MSQGSAVPRTGPRTINALQDNNIAVLGLRLSFTNEELDRFLNRLQDAKFALESTGIWEFISEGIEKRGFDAVLVYPLKVKAIAEARVKMDKVDAETLALLLRTRVRKRAELRAVPTREN